MIDLLVVFKNNIFTIGIIASMIIWGISWSVAKVLSNYSDPITLTLVRYGIVIIMFPICLKLLKVPIKINKNGILPLLGAGGFMALYTLSFFYGLQIGKAGKAGVLVTTINPIFAYVIGIIVSKITPNKKEITGLTFGLISGVILLKLYEDVSLFLEAQNYIFVLGALLWAIMAKFSSKAKNYGHPLAFSFWINVITFLAVLPFVNIQHITEIFAIKDTLFWGNMGYFSIINTIGATSIFILATNKLGAEKSSAFIFIVPLMAALSTWIFLGETIEINTIIGGTLGMISVFLINSNK